jgi:membrane protein
VFPTSNSTITHLRKLMRKAKARAAATYWWRVIRATITEIDEDRCLDLAAQLAFYFLLALFPGLLVLVSLLGYLPIEHATADLLALLRHVAPTEVVDLLAVQRGEILRDGRAGLATVGMVGAFWSSSAAMLAIIEALNQTYRVAEWRPWWKRRLVAIVLTLAFGLSMTISLLLILAGPDAVKGVASLVGIDGVIASGWLIVRWPAMVALVVIGIDVVYYFAPNRVAQWSWTTPGSLVATGLWIGSSLLFRLYVTHMGTYSVTYGAIGGVIVALLWLYMSSLAILVGAEVNSVIADLARQDLEDAARGQVSQVHPHPGHSGPHR